MSRFFTHQKFSKLSKQSQHKKCAELLEKIYLNPKDSLIEQYQQLAKWMKISPISLNQKEISDRYHFHLKEADLSKKEHNLLPNITTKDREVAEPLLPVSIYLDGIRSAHNVGSILRTIEAFSLGKAYFSPATPPPTHKQVKDASMGAWEWVEYEICEDISTLPTPLIALETSPDATPIQDYLFPERFTLVIGNEEYGCSDAILQAADAIVTIPLRGRKNSLNVANAFSITAFQIVNQPQRGG